MLAHGSWLTTLVVFAACGRFRFDDESSTTSQDAHEDAPVIPFELVQLPPGGSVWHLAIESPTTFYAAYDGARVLRTDDGGQTWVDCASVDARALALDASGVLYAADGDVQISTDRCASWQAAGVGDDVATVAVVANRVFAGTANGLRERVAGAWNPIATPLDGQRVQVIAGAPSGQPILIGSDDSGAARWDGSTWSLSNTGLPNLNVASIDVAASLPTRVYLSCIGLGANLGGAVRSDDGGATWTNIHGLGGVSIAVSPTNPDEAVFAEFNNLLRTQNAGGSFAGIRTSVLAGVSTRNVKLTNGRIYLATEVGVYDSASSPIAWQARVGDIQGARVFGFLKTPAGDVQYIGTEGGLLRSIAGAPFTTHKASFASVEALVVPPGTPDVVITVGRQIWQSTDRGDLFTVLYNPGQGDAFRITSIAIDDTSRLFAGTATRVVTADPPWTTWTPRSLDGSDHTVTDLLVRGPGHVLVATVDGLYETTNGGASYAVVTGAPSDLRDLELTATGVWAASGDGVWAVDGTATRRGLAGVEVRALLSAGTTVVAATGSGVRATSDGGTSWFELPGLEQSETQRLGIGTDGSLLVGTNGHGVWRRPLPTAP